MKTIGMEDVLRHPSIACRPPVWLCAALVFVAISAPVGVFEKNAAIPDLGLEPGKSSFRAPDSSIGAESIDPFTGILKIVNTDLVVPSNGGPDITIVRSYNGGSTPNQVVPENFGRTNTGIGWDIHSGHVWPMPYRRASIPSLTFEIRR